MLAKETAPPPPAPLPTSNLSVPPPPMSMLPLAPIAMPPTPGSRNGRVGVAPTLLAVIVKFAVFPVP